MSTDSVSVGIACGELVFGLAYLTWSLTGNAYQGGTFEGRLLARSFAPVSVMFMLTGTFR